ncbi:hypothetical protein [Aureimonas sp. ME7]|uniref:hypothetical protein n=1 Tax=Aureimonas sp. ME7 TaxID=2744252 RepID=UPI0015F99FCE|nr:hypothetical protein [Aureimonas sp. ME7]
MSPVADIIQIVGMNLDEVHAYLVARGLECSPHSVKAWNKGMYRPPEEAVVFLWELVIVLFDDFFEDGETTLQAGVPDLIRSLMPEKVRRRGQALAGINEWQLERRRDDHEIAGEGGDT